MKTKPTVSALVALSSALVACVIPASVFERSSHPGTIPSQTPPDYWQGQGRYRQEPSPSSTDAAGGQEPATSEPPPGAELAGHSAPPLYAWDGGVVDGAPQGQVVQESASRGPEAPPTGRMHIIELYQQVLEERDALAAEVRGLEAALEKTAAELEAERTQRATLETRVAALEEGHRGLLEENRDLGARLTTAQIRRLESEKLLLETRIEMHRARAAEEERARVRPASRIEAGKKGSGGPASEKENAERDGGGA